MKYIILLRNDKAKSTELNDFFIESGRMFSAIDPQSQVISFDDPDETLSYLLSHYSINEARVAILPEMTMLDNALQLERF